MSKRRIFSLAGLMAAGLVMAGANETDLHLRPADDGSDTMIRPQTPISEAARDWRRRRDEALAARPDLGHDPTTMLVKFRAHDLPEWEEAIRGMFESETVETWDLVPGLEHLTCSRDSADAAEVVQRIAGALGIVEYAEPDYLYRLGATPNDTSYGLLWGLNNTGQTVNKDRGTANNDIDANLAWDVTTGSSAVVVGMADSGVRRTHVDLAANIWTNPGEIAGNGVDDDGNGYTDDTWGWDFWNNDNNPDDDNGHGSHTAGTVGAVGNNGTGLTGVCWTVRLVGLKIGSASGSVSSSAGISAVNYCVTKGIKVSNHSWGGSTSSSAFNSAVTSAQAAGHMLVCAAGNSGVSTPFYPASYSHDNILSVAAVDNDGRMASFSNYGATNVDLGAPGVTIYSCSKNSNTSYAYLSGTSMAAPHVTGTAALVWARNPSWTYAQVRSKILSSAKPLSSLAGKTVTGGLLNANNAVR